MSVPIIDQILVVPPILHECERALITILAHETISGDVVLSLRVSNDLGEVTHRDVIIPLTGGGVLTYKLTEVPVPGRPPGEILQDVAHPNQFIYVAPCPDDPHHDPHTHTTTA